MMTLTSETTLSTVKLDYMKTENQEHVKKKIKTGGAITSDHRFTPR